ncbi:ABC transporter permease [Xylocopilactobacillus apicola]|uniref:Spermidine/putrescine ABC transporter permease n=1 Tax=Xylocopilactobacillus apicola TaxID=2932184 RepID=A0AAU9D8T3_9LACO|nr:ABC transporter permease [Xylocopilactobacillus apicola]BDR58760.1 spermidine/putrescine ABC transporter permease [Xylocopilactobacillus apicola]
MRTKIKNRLFLLVVFVIMYLPIFYLIYFSFSSGDNMAQFGHFSLEHYGNLLADHRLIGIMINTILIALISATLATVIGTLGALYLNGLTRKWLKSLLLTFNNILMVSPDVIIGASFLILFSAFKVSLGFWSVLFSHVAFSIPIVVLMVLPKLKELKHSYIDAAYDLGASAPQVLSQVILPFISSGIFAGFFMALTYSLDDFAVTFFVTGNGFETLSVEIYARARRGISLEINALTGLIFIVITLSILFYYFVMQRKSKKGRERQK